jgi:hypothetical protein
MEQSSSSSSLGLRILKCQLETKILLMEIDGNLELYQKHRKNRQMMKSKMMKL